MPFIETNGIKMHYQEKPDKVQSMVLISTRPKFNNYATVVYENLKKLRRVADPGDFMELLKLWIFAADCFEENLDTLKEGQEAARNNPRSQTRQGFDGQLDACIHHDVVDQLANIKVPAYIVVGEDDIFTPLPFSQLLHEKIPGSEIWIIPRTGNVCHWEELAAFNRRTTEFLLNH